MRGPGCAGPGRGRARGEGAWQTAGLRGRLLGPRPGARRVPPSPVPFPPESGFPTAGRRGRGGGGSRRIRGPPTTLPCGPPGAGRAGWPGEGKGVGEGGGERGGALARCSFGAAPAAATAAASFPIHSNKQDGCRYAAALPAAQTLGSNRQDVYGQNGTCAPAQLASGPDGATQAQ